LSRQNVSRAAILTSTQLILGKERELTSSLMNCMGKTAWSRRKKGKAGAVSLSPIPMLPGRGCQSWRARTKFGVDAMRRVRALVWRNGPMFSSSPSISGHQQSRARQCGGRWTRRTGLRIAGSPRVCNGSLDLGPGRSRLVSKQWITIFYSPCAKVKGN